MSVENTDNEYINFQLDSKLLVDRDYYYFNCKWGFTGWQ
jgi:hypothetical protein